MTHAANPQNFILPPSMLASLMVRDAVATIDGGRLEGCLFSHQLQTWIDDQANKHMLHEVGIRCATFLFLSTPLGHAAWHKYIMPVLRLN